MRSASLDLVHCPHCLATNLDGEERCLDCGRSLTLGGDPEARLTSRFGLGSLMLVVALVAICLVVVREALVLGVVQLVIVVPAFFRTIQWSALRAADRQPMAVYEKMGAFITSSALVCLLLFIALWGYVAGWLLGGILLVPVVALLVPEPSFWVQSALLVIPLVLGAIGALATIYFLGRVLWPVKTYGLR